MKIQDGQNDLIVITGAKGSGKSTLAHTFLPPSQVGKLFSVDSEHSANRIITNLAEQGLKLGYYLDMQSRFGGLPEDEDLLDRINAGKLPWVDKSTRNGLIEYYGYMLEQMDKELRDNKFDTVVVDTVEKLEAGMAAWVEKNKSAAGVTTTAYGKLWTEGVYPLYEAFLSSIFNRGVKTVVMTTHLKTPWEGNKPIIGKVKPAGKKILYFLSSLMLWVMKDTRNASGAPAGLVLKERLGKIRADKKADSWDIQRMLPNRIPVCTWSEINRYLENGYDPQNPKEGEVLSEDEAEMMSDLISDKQMELMLLHAKQELAEKSEEIPSVLRQPVNPVGPDVSAIDEAVKEALDSGASNAIKIRDYIQSKLDVEVSMPQVIAAKNRVS